jgi:hypothetical protein
MKKIILFSSAVFFITFFSLLADDSTKVLDSFGELQGKVTDIETGEALPFTAIGLFKDAVLKNKSAADSVGDYSIKQIPMGTNYEIITYYVGYYNDTIKGISINADMVCFLNIQLRRNPNIKFSKVR